MLQLKAPLSVDDMQASTSITALQNKPARQVWYKQSSFYMSVLIGAFGYLLINSKTQMLDVESSYAYILLFSCVLFVISVIWSQVWSRGGRAS